MISLAVQLFRDANVLRLDAPEAAPVIRATPDRAVDSLSMRSD